MNFKNISICLTLLVALTAVTAANATQKQIQSTDLVEQDADAAIVVCGDLNNHINHMYQ